MDLAPWWRSTACHPADRSRWSSASGCRCTRPGGVHTEAAEPLLLTRARSQQFLCPAASSGKIKRKENQIIDLHSFIKTCSITDSSNKQKKIKTLLRKHLTVDQLDKPVAVVDIIGLTGCDTTQLVADTWVLLWKHHKLVRFLNQFLEHRCSYNKNKEVSAS